MAGPVSFQKPFRRLSDRLGAGAAVGDLKYLLPAEVTTDYLPPDGRRVYKSDYPDLAGKLREFNEGDTLNWITAATALGSTYNTYDTIAIADDGTVYVVAGSLGVCIVNPATGAKQYANGFAASVSGVAVVGSYICVGLANGNFSVYNRTAYNSGTSSFGTSIYANTSTFNNDICVATLANRYFIIHYRGTASANFFQIDMSVVPITTAGNLSFEAGGTNVYIKRVHPYGPDKVVISAYDATASTYPWFAVFGPPAATGAFPVRVSTWRYTGQTGFAGLLGGFANPSIGGLLFGLQGGTTLYKVGIGSDGILTQTLAGQSSALPSGYADMCYDEGSDTLVLQPNTTTTPLRRVKGKKFKFSGAGATTFTSTDFEDASIPSRGTSQVYGLATRDGAFYAFSPSSPGGPLLLKAGDANAKPAFNLPNVSIANQNDRADGRTPYVKVR